MARKTRGGAEILTRLIDLTTGVDKLLRFTRRTLVSHPEDVEEDRDLARAYLDQILTILRDELPPMLERAERNREAAGRRETEDIPDRVARVEAELAELREALSRRPELRLVEPRRASEGG